MPFKTRCYKRGKSVSLKLCSSQDHSCSRSISWPCYHAVQLIGRTRMQVEARCTSLTGRLSLQNDNFGFIFYKFTMPNPNFFHAKFFFFFLKRISNIDQKTNDHRTIQCSLIWLHAVSRCEKSELLQQTTTFYRHEGEINYCVKECLFRFNKRLCNTLAWGTPVVIFPWILRRKHLTSQNTSLRLFRSWVGHSICLQEHRRLQPHTQIQALFHCLFFFMASFTIFATV